MLFSLSDVCPLCLQHSGLQCEYSLHLRNKCQPIANMYHDYCVQCS